MALTILGGKGFVGAGYIESYYHHAIGNIASVNERNDYQIKSADVLYFISTVTNKAFIKDPFIDIDTNLTTLMKVLENWRLYQNNAEECGVFNFISSWFVYGSNINAKETDQCNPAGFYSSTKRCAELLLESYCKAYDLKYRILRLANVIGKGDKKVSPDKNALQYVVNRLKNNEPVELIGNGEFFRDYIHVSDCARAIDIVMTKGDLNSIYNIGNGPTWSFGCIVKYVRNMLGSKSIITLTGGTPLSFVMNTDKLKALGYKPMLLSSKLYDTLCEG